MEALMEEIVDVIANAPVGTVDGRRIDPGGLVGNEALVHALGFYVMCSFHHPPRAGVSTGTG
jgi:hypothetical protein